MSAAGVQGGTSEAIIPEKSSRINLGPPATTKKAAVTVSDISKQSTSSEKLRGVETKSSSRPFSLRSRTASAGSCTQTCLLFCLIWKLKKRQGKFAFFFEVIFPLLLLAILTGGGIYVNQWIKEQKARGDGDRMDTDDERIMGPTMTKNSTPNPSRPQPKGKLIGLREFMYSYGVQPNENGIRSYLPQQLVHIAPASTFTTKEFKDAMSSVWTDNFGTSGPNVKFYNSEGEMKREFIRQNNRPLLGLVLPTSYNPRDTFRYKIKTTKGVPIPPPSMTRWFCRTGSSRIPACPARGYSMSNVLALQSMVEQTVARLSLLSANPNSNPKVKLDVAMFTVSSYLSPTQRQAHSKKQAGQPRALGTDDKTLEAKFQVTFFGWMFVLPTLLAMIGLLNSFTIFLVGEKTEKIKEALKMMGMPNHAYWLAWFGVYGSLVLIFWLAYAIAVEFVVLPGNLPGIFTLLYGLYGLSILSLALLLSTLFQKPKLVKSYVASLSSSLGSSAPDEVDVIFEPHHEAIYYACISLAVDTVLYTLLALYLDRVLPGENGARYPHCFCILPSYWRKSKKMQMDTEDANFAAVGMEQDIEPPSHTMVGKEAIQLREVHKTYTALLGQNRVTALKGVTLDIYEGQITAILGRNGAGKTTLLSILLGLTSPTKGKAIVYGYDTSRPSDMAEIRKLVGPCLQQDLHYPNLTVNEHMMFFGQLRGLQSAQIYASTSKVLAKLNLEVARGTHAKNLSGGQKRKLSVAIALVGDPPDPSRAIFGNTGGHFWPAGHQFDMTVLDEPTAGLDPSSRRNLWDVLRWRKEGRVILLTTHFMDEADILADRKAIIHEGVVRCVGSSLFLKNRFGVGYHLVVELGPRERDTAKVDNIVQRSVPEAMDSRKKVAHTVSYSLPITETSNFPKLLSEIEQEMKDGGVVKNIGIELTTLEEVFLKIAYTSGVDRDQTEECDLLEQKLSLKPNKFTMLMMLAKLRLYRLIRSAIYLFLILIVPLAIGLVAFSVVANYNTDAEKRDYGPDPDPDPQPNETVAVRDGPNAFHNILEALKLNWEPFHGDMMSFWKTTPRKNDMLGAVSIEEVRTTSSEHYLKAQISANGNFLHSQTKLLHIVSEYFNRLAGTGAGGNATSLKRQGPGGYNGYADSLMLLVTNGFTFFLCGTAISFASSAVAIETVRDKELKVRHHLRLNGVTFSVYYGSIFMAFGLLLLILILLLLLMIWVVSDGKVVNIYGIVWAGILLTINIPAQLIFASAFAIKQSSSSSAEVSYILMVVFLGMITIALMMAVDLVATFSPQFGITPSVSSGFHIALSVLNVFYVPGIVFYWILREYAVQRINLMGMHPEPSFGFYNTTEIRIMFFCTLAQIALMFFILYQLDKVTKGGMEALKKVFRRQSVASESSLTKGEESEYEDVEEETGRVAEYFHSRGGDSSVVVAVKDLWKNYPSQTVLHGISFMVSEGEILGLLGHNGAGKTTSIRIMTGEETPDAGHVKMCGHEIQSSHSEAFKQLGFCPQHDALWDNITLGEHIELYAVLHGVSISDSKRLISDILSGLSIEEHRKKYSQKLSGGTKRKLCYAMSIIGFPRIVIMDEPSTGMDPHSKRYLWNTVLGTFKGSRGAILTTHSMEEADFLCTRIAVMLHGRIVAIGTPQNLKSKFGAGYTLEIKLKFSETEENLEEKPVKGQSKKNLSQKSSKKTIPEEFQFLADSFPGARLLEAFGNRAVFSVPMSGIQSVSQAFSTLENLKESQHIEEYSFSQTTLEQAYLTICRGVEEDR